MYFLGVSELLAVKVLVLNLKFSSKASISVRSQRLLYTATCICPLGAHIFCPFSRDRRLSISQSLKMYYFYGKISRGHIACPLYGGSPYLRESVIRGSTV